MNLFLLLIAFTHPNLFFYILIYWVWLLYLKPNDNDN